MNNLKVQGTQNFMGVEIPVVEGGFGEGQKVLLAKTIAEIHGTELRTINQTIDRNIEEFEFGVDLLDLKNSITNCDSLSEGGIYTKQQIANSKNIYLLSEQGYMLLVGFMRTQKAKEIRKQLRREYFAMREVIKSDEQLKAQLLLSIYNGGQEGIVASKQLTEIEVQEAKKPLLKTIDEKEAIIDRTINDDGLFEIGVVGKMLKPYCDEFGARKIFAFLHKKGVLRNRPETQVHNNPYDKFAKYFEMRNVEVETTWGSRTYCKTYFNGKGLKWFLNKLAKEGYITKEQIEDIKF